MKKTAIIKLLFVSVFLAFSQFANSQTINITIKNVRSANGKFQVSIFASAEEFKADKPSHVQFFDKSNYKDKTCVISLKYKAGTYGISINDDENDNGKMDWNFLGMPKEGFGLSNYQIKGLSRPTFSDFSFPLKENENKAVTVVMKYL